MIGVPDSYMITDVYLYVSVTKNRPLMYAYLKRTKIIKIHTWSIIFIRIILFILGMSVYCYNSDLDNFLT